MTKPFVPVEAVPTKTFLRSRLKSLVLFNLVLPVDFGGIEAKSEVRRFAPVTRPGIKGDDASGIDRAADAFAPGAVDVLPGLDHEPEKALVFLVAVLQFFAPGLRVALLPGQVH